MPYHMPPEIRLSGPADMAAVDALLARAYPALMAADYPPDLLDKALQESGLGEFFHATRCADETFSKPHPQMLLEIMDLLGVEPAETLMIGDTEYDMQMAANAGVAALAVSYGVHPVDALLRIGARGHIDAIRELPDWLSTPPPTASPAASPAPPS